MKRVPPSARLKEEIEGLLQGETFGASRLSKSTVSRVTQQLNQEFDRRTKVIPRFPTERSCLTLLYASLRTASRHWRGIPMTTATLRQLQQLRSTMTPIRKEEAAVA